MVYDASLVYCFYLLFQLNATSLSCDIFYQHNLEVFCLLFGLFLNSSKYFIFLSCCCIILFYQCFKSEIACYSARCEGRQTAVLRSVKRKRLNITVSRTFSSEWDFALTFLCFGMQQQQSGSLFMLLSKRVIYATSILSCNTVELSLSYKMYNIFEHWKFFLLNRITCLVFWIADFEFALTKIVKKILFLICKI